MYNKKIPVDINCGFRIAMEVIGGKWKSYIIYDLLQGPKRPSELLRHAPGVNERVVAQQLKELVEYGIVTKHVIDSVCKHTEYSLTEVGRTLEPIIRELQEWGDGFRPRMIEILKNKEE
jgi:DNA-binding HxlR family transcriptional regulator